MLYGASGVGKSYLAYDFAKNYFSEFIYLDFKRNKSEIETLLTIRTKDSLDQLFVNGSSFCDAINHTEDEMEKQDNPNLLLILDNMQILNDVKLTQQKRSWFLEQLLQFSDFIQSYPSTRLLCISSEIIHGIEFEDSFTLFPLDFEEYLASLGHDWYIESVKIHYKSNQALPDIVHNELLGFFQQYLQVGGMPLAINELLATKSVFNIAKQHDMLETSYLHKMRSRVDGEGMKTLQVYNTIAKHIIRNNKKFQYNRIRRGATTLMYHKSMEEIHSTFQGIPCFRIVGREEDIINKNSTYLTNILDEEKDYHNIKLYHYDVGLLYSTIHNERDVYDLEEESIKNEIMEASDETILRGLYENSVAITLAQNGYSLMYWDSGSMAKIEFVIVKEGKLIPIEVRADEKTRSKNHSIFKLQYSTALEQVKVSTRNFEYSNGVKYVPIYAVFCI